MEENNNAEQNLKKILEAALLILIAGALAFGIYLFMKKNPIFEKKVDKKIINVASERSDLSNRNSDFEMAESLIASNPKEATNYYRSALNKATSQADIDSISFRIALATYKSGEISDAVSLFKDLIASSTVSNITKAYSVQFLAQEYFSVNDNYLFNQIFSGEPYAGYFSNNNKDEAMEKLVEYGKSFQPLPILALRSADYKARDLINLNLGESEKNYLLSEIGSDIRIADAGIEALRGSPNIDQLPVIYNRKLILSTNLKRAGHVLGDPSDSYNKGSDYANLYGDRNTLMFLNLNYAIYLNIENASQNSETIKNTLRKIYEEEDKNLKIFQYLKNKASANRKTDEAAKFINELASVDNSFKSFLQNLGWKF